VAARPRRGIAALVLAGLAWLAAGPAAQTTDVERVRVLSYNIHHGEGVDGRLDLERIARVIRSVEPDLVALQEVDRRATRSGSVDQPAELGRLTGLQAVFGPNIPLQGGDYGNAVLSRWRILRSENHHLPNVDAGEQRGVLEVHIESPVTKTRVVLWATHFDHRRPDAERLASAEAIRARLARQSTEPALLVGDLNDVPTSPTLASLSSDWTRTNTEILPTIPVGKPARQIDYVLFRPASRWRAVETRVLEEAVASDHRPLFALLELRPAG
jgi:endonuclease/exonuclease/phosphatase family metal-dependent hydrolase